MMSLPERAGGIAWDWMGVGCVKRTRRRAPRVALDSPSRSKDSLTASGYHGARLRGKEPRPALSILLRGPKLLGPGLQGPEDALHPLGGLASVPQPLRDGVEVGDGALGEGHQGGGHVAGVHGV